MFTDIATKELNAQPIAKNLTKSEIDKIYSSKLANIEAQIKTEIEKKAKADGYDFVFAKSVALYGGKDITPEISGMVK